MKTSKKKTMIGLSILLVAAIAIGATMAYLNAKTNTAENVFTFADNIRGKLLEPNWEPLTTPLTPGAEVRKDPMIQNTSDNGVDTYVALQLTFTDGDGNTLSDEDTVRLLNMLEISWNTADWALEDGTLTVASGAVTDATATQVYVYQSVLAPGAISNPVFSTVKIKADVSDADYAWLAAIALDHEDSCYTFGTCDCTVTYKHHKDCAVETSLAAESAKGENDCDCTPAVQHEADCASLQGSLTGSCAHEAPDGALDGYRIQAQGSLLQYVAGEMDSVALATPELVALFN